MYIKIDLSIFLQLLHLEFFLYLVGEQPVQAMRSGRIHLKYIALPRLPFRKYIITFQVYGITDKIERYILPQTIHFLLQTDGCRIYACQRFGKGKSNIIIHIHCGRSIHIYRQEFRIRFLLFLILLFLSLFPFFLFLLLCLPLLLLQLFISQFGKQLQSIRTGNQLLQTIRIKIRQTHF